MGQMCTTTTSTTRDLSIAPEIVNNVLQLQLQYTGNCTIQYTVYCTIYCGKGAKHYNIIVILNANNNAVLLSDNVLQCIVNTYNSVFLCGGVHSTMSSIATTTTSPMPS